MQHVMFPVPVPAPAPVASCLTLAAFLSLLFAAGSARGHDTWVWPSAALVRPGDVVHVGFALGNHGNEHRDFKYAGKLSALDAATLEVVGPDGRRTDVVPELVDLGSAPREGYYSARHVVGSAGLHVVAHTLDTLHHTTRAIKSGKAYFLAAPSLDRPPPADRGFATPLGHPFELVPDTHPVLATGPGVPITVQLRFRGRPLVGHRVSFIPRGAALAVDFDPEYERLTDDEGRCTWTPGEGTMVLVVAHHVEPDERGEAFERTAYAATLVLDVPQRCLGCE